MTISVGYGLPDLPDNPTPDDVAVVLQSIPGLNLDRQSIADILASPPAVAEADIQVLLASSVQPSGDAMATFLNVLKAIVVVAGGVAGVSGAIAGVQAIKWK